MKRKIKFGRLFAMLITIIWTILSILFLFEIHINRIKIANSLITVVGIYGIWNLTFLIEEFK